MPATALDWLPVGARCVLDMGCNVGDTIRGIAKRGVPAVRGVDINSWAIELAKQRLADLPNVEVAHASGDSLPHGDGEFDAITCFEVLEHVPAELRRAVVNEMGRTLQPQGRLIMSVPHRGMFGWLDPENMRFRLPGLYQFVNRWIGGRGKEAGYEGQKHGVVFHHHFTRKELRDLLSPGFGISRIMGQGFLVVPLGCWLRWPFYRRERRDHIVCRAIEAIMQLEYRMPIPASIAFSVIVVADKVS